MPAADSSHSPLRIAVVETAQFGGLLHYAFQLADALAEGGEDVDLIVPAGNELDSRPGAARRRALLPRWLPAPSSVETPLRILARRARTAAARIGAWLQIVRAVRRERYDAVVLNGSVDLWLTAVGALGLVALSRGARVTHVCHNVRPFNRWGGGELFVSSRLLMGLLRVLYPAFDLVFVHGERSREEFCELWPRAHVRVIPHGDEHIFAEHPPPPASEPRALFFGDWRRVKGLEVLIAAFDQLSERMPHARLTIAGSPAHEEGEVETVLRWSARHAERVEVIAGYVPVDEVLGVFARARVVALPYLVGYQSGVLHLAMTMARAVVASDVGDLSAAVREGETGLLVPAGDARALAAALEQLLADASVAERMGAAARARVESASAWPRVAEQVSAELQRLGHGHAARPWRRRGGA